VSRDRLIYLVSNGDHRESACRVCWPTQEQTLKQVEKAFAKVGVKTRRAHGYDDARKHGFITRQADGARVFSEIPADAPVVVVLSCWAYAHHVTGPLQTHRGPILLLGNFDGTWPGLVALLNHAGTLARLNVAHARLWTDSFLKDDYFMQRLEKWARTGKLQHSEKHVAEVDGITLSADSEALGRRIGESFLRERRIMGQLDPGCMGMINAVLDPAKVGACGMPIEYLNQSDLLAEMDLVSEEEAQKHLNWLVRKGTWFDWGVDPFTDLTHDQVRTQMKMYAAACRFYQRYGLSAIGIPYQLGLVRQCPASDLVEGMLNNADRPPVRCPDTRQVINGGKPIVHFNEGDLGSGIPQLMMQEVLEAKGLPSETTLHDVRWGREWEGRFIWVFLISGAAPPAHFGGWKYTQVYRQPAMYFPKGGGTCAGVSKPGVITWARCFEANGALWMDCGTGEVVSMPEQEVRERLEKTTPQWPIANVHIPGYGRNEMMATHMANHITIGYGDILEELIALCRTVGIRVRVAGDVRKKLGK
jgi:L-fucose isomerase-like protein